MENPAPEGALEWRASRFHRGRHKTVACVQRSERNDRPEEGGTLNSGGPELHPHGGDLSPGDQRVSDDKKTRRRDAGSQTRP